MPTIFSPTDISEGNVPTREDLLEAQDQIHQTLSRAYADNHIAGATSYGSVCKGGRRFDNASDLDWLIVMNDLPGMFSSPALEEIQKIVSTKHIAWGGPVIAADTLRHGLHHIGPLLYGIKTSKERIVIGKDPVDISGELGIDPYESRRIRNILSATSRYGIERMAINKAGDNMADSVQQSVDMFQETYRNMIVYAAGKDNHPYTLGFGSYQRLFDSKLSEAESTAGAEVNAFLKKYRSMLSRVCSEPFHKNKRMRLKLASFLEKQSSLPLYASMFTTGNCKILDQESL